MNELLWHSAAVLFGLFAFVDFLVLIWLAIHSRRWEGAHQAGLIDETRKTIDILRGNVGRVQREHAEDKHDTLESLSRLWDELRGISERLDSMRCPLRDPACPLKVVVTEPDKETPKE